MDKKKKERRLAEKRQLRRENNQLKEAENTGKSNRPDDDINILSSGDIRLEAIASVPDQYPSDDLPEIAFAGRSNVGKSSLLNLITGRKKLAFVSGSPGKTRTINFYNINDRFRIVDLPGYGYAKVSKNISADWGRMMETYLSSRPNLKKVVQLVDIRHEPTPQDIQMYDYLKYYGYDGIVVATKSDKVSNNQIREYINNIRTALKLSEDDIVIPVSALNRKGHEKVLDAVREILEMQ